MVRATPSSANLRGVIYKLARDGSKYTLIVNPESEQLQPRALAEGPDGKLYALARQGLVRCNKDGSDFTVLQEMNGGFFPWCAVVNGGAFYSTTAQGGKGGGIIFRYGIGGSPSGGAVEPAGVIQNVPTTPLDANVELPAQ